MLCITDVLLNNLINEAMERDSKKGNKKVLQGRYLNALVKAIQQCGVSFNIWEKRMVMVQEVDGLTGQV